MNENEEVNGAESGNGVKPDKVVVPNGYTLDGSFQTQSSRPSKVSAAVTLLYVSFAIGVLQLPIEIPHFCEENEEIPVPVMVLLVLAILPFFWFLIYKIGQGRNWARITYLVLFIISVPEILAGMFQRSGTAQASALVTVATAVMEVIAFVFLFDAPSSAWFRQTKEQRSQQPPVTPTRSNLYPCPDCGRRVSRLAETCPQCGRPLESQQQSENESS